MKYIVSLLFVFLLYCNNAVSQLALSNITIVDAKELYNLSMSEEIIVKVRVSNINEEFDFKIFNNVAEILFNIPYVTVGGVKKYIFSVDYDYPLSGDSGLPEEFAFETTEDVGAVKVSTIADIDALKNKSFYIRLKPLYSDLNIKTNGVELVFQLSYPGGLDLHDDDVVPDATIFMRSNPIKINDEAPLNINTINLLGVSQHNMAKLTWDNTLHNDIKVFELQHATDGIHYKTINEQYNNVNNSTYNYNHLLSQGDNFYRIIIHSIDGTTKITNVVKLQYDEVSNVQLYPNPTENVVIINNVHSSSDIQVFDIQGKQVNVMTTLDNNKIILDVQHLLPGTYMLKLDNDTNQQYKFVKL